MRASLAVLFVVVFSRLQAWGHSYCESGKAYSYILHHAGKAQRLFDCSPKLLRNDSLQVLDIILEPVTSLPTRWHWSRAMTSHERQLPLEVRLRLLRHDISLLQNFVQLRSTDTQEYDRLTMEHDEFLTEKIRREQADLEANLKDAKILLRNITVLQHRFELRKKLMVKTGGFRLLNNARNLRRQLDDATNEVHGFVMSMASLVQRIKMNHVTQVHRDFDEFTWLETYQHTSLLTGNATLAHARIERENAMWALANATHFAGKSRNQSARVGDLAVRLSSGHHDVICDHVGDSVYRTKRKLSKVRLRALGQNRNDVFNSVRLQMTLNEMKSRDSTVKQRSDAIVRTFPRMRRSRRKVQSALQHQLPLIQDAVTNTRILTRSLTIAKPFRKVLSDRSDMLKLAKQAASVEEDVARTLMEASRLLSVRAALVMTGAEQRRHERRQRLRKVLRRYRQMLLTAGDAKGTRGQRHSGWFSSEEMWPYPADQLSSKGARTNGPFFGSMLQSEDTYSLYATSMPERRLLWMMGEGSTDDEPETEEAPQSVLNYIQDKISALIYGSGDSAASDAHPGSGDVPVKEDISVSGDTSESSYGGVSIESSGNSDSAEGSGSGYHSESGYFSGSHKVVAPKSLPQETAAPDENINKQDNEVIEARESAKLQTTNSSRRRLLWLVGFFDKDATEPPTTTTIQPTTTTTTATEQATTTPRLSAIIKTSAPENVDGSGDGESGDDVIPSNTESSAMGEIPRAAPISVASSTDSPKPTTMEELTSTTIPDVTEAAKTAQEQSIEVGRISEGIRDSGQKLRVIAKDIQKELHIQADVMETTTKALRMTNIETLIPSTVATNIDRKSLQEKARRMSEITASIAKFSSKVDDLAALLSESARYLNQTNMHGITADVKGQVDSSDQLEREFAQCKRKLHKAITARQQSQRQLDGQIQSKRNMISITTAMLASSQKTASINNTQAFRSSFFVAWNNRKGDVLSFEVKTRSKSGLLLRLYNPLPEDVERADAKAHKREVDIRLVRGMPHLIWKVQGQQLNLPLSSPIDTGHWHTLRLKINGTKVQLMTFPSEQPDNKKVVMLTLKSDKDVVVAPLQLQLGQSLKSSNARAQSFRACLADVQINDFHIPFWLARDKVNRAPPTCAHVHPVGGKFRRSPPRVAADRSSRMQRARVHRHEVRQTTLAAHTKPRPVLVTEIRVRPNEQSRRRQSAAWRRAHRPTNRQRQARKGSTTPRRPNTQQHFRPPSYFHASTKQMESTSHTRRLNNTFRATVIATASQGTILLYQSALDAITTLRLRNGVLVLEGFSGRKVFRKVCPKYLDDGTFHHIGISSSPKISRIQVDCEPCMETKMAVLPSSSSGQFKTRLLLKGRHDRLRLPLRRLPDQGKELIRFQGYIGQVFFNDRSIRQPPMPKTIRVNPQHNSKCPALNDSIHAIIRRK